MLPPTTLTMGDHYQIKPLSVIEVEKIGKAGIRGEQSQSTTGSRKSYSAFPVEIATMCAELFMRDAEVVCDPFAGWGERHLACANEGISYIGFDLSPEAIDYAKTTYGVDNILGDSRCVDVPNHDGLVTCPPYWKLERYDNDGGLDKLSNWESFLIEYELILTRFAAKANPEATYCITTGDWRSQGIYYDLTYQTAKIMEKLGFTRWDSVIFTRVKKVNYNIMLPQVKRLGYTVKLHETLNVWKKA